MVRRVSFPLIMHGRYFIALGVLGLFLQACALAQSADDVSLGDLARSLRKDTASAQTVIDNDNLSQVMVDANKLKLDGPPVFSFDGGGKKFQMSSPDGTCSLSFNANMTALISDPLVAREVPQSELAKVDGPATIDSDTLEVSIYNGTDWNLTEITVGLTIVRHDDPEAPETASLGAGKLIRAVERTVEPAPEEPRARRSDRTALYHLRGSAAPLKTTVFREMMASAIEPGEEWHWAIVAAKGVPVKTEPAKPLSEPQLPLQSHPLAQPASIPAQPM